MRGHPRFEKFPLRFNRITPVLTKLARRMIQIKEQLIFVSTPLREEEVYEHVD